MYLQMAQARGRANRGAEPSAVHETLGLKVRCDHAVGATALRAAQGWWSPAAAA